ALNLEKVEEITNYCRGKIGISFGIGTNLTNDVGLKPMNIVMKLIGVQAPNKEWIPTEKKAEKSKYNQELATSLGADKYGMKPYTIVMLTTGTTKIEDKAKMGELMKGHMSNI
uniref:Nicotinate/nicotinamide phosphoribosyltransferase domain-containing protein n=1 Tax=Romanomermis culicivorax TaxID=13658 RepID=A0A915HZP9_ROMCU